MAYLLDGVILTLFVEMILIGRHRGFIKTVAGLAAFVAALVLASFLGGPVSELVYDKTVEPMVLETIDKNVGEDSPAADKLDTALAEMPGFVTNVLQNADIQSGADVLEKLSGTQEGESVAESISRQVVAPVVMPLLKMLCTLLLFVVAFILASVLLKALNVVAKLPLLKQLNTMLGGFAGAVSGILWMIFAVSVLQVLAYMGTIALLTPELLQSTILTKWLCDVNPLAGALQEAMALISAKA